MPPTWLVRVCALRSFPPKIFPDFYYDVDVLRSIPEYSGTPESANTRTYYDTGVHTYILTPRMYKCYSFLHTLGTPSIRICVRTPPTESGSAGASLHSQISP